VKWQTTKTKKTMSKADEATNPEANDLAAVSRAKANLAEAKVAVHKAAGVRPLRNNGELKIHGRVFRLAFVS
jgi:hypothetical protein